MPKDFPGHERARGGGNGRTTGAVEVDVDSADRGHQRRRGLPLGVTAVLVVAGLLFSASAIVADGDDLRTDVADLPALIAAETKDVEAKAERVTQLRAEVEELSERTGDTRVQDLQAVADTLGFASGTQPVEGPGVEVVLDDVPRDRPLPEGVAADLLVVHQEDVQAVVNALWAGGAEAMTLMDQRVISTSAVRCVGSTLRLQGRVYSPPYTIRAVGDTGALLRALEESRDVQIYREYVDAYGLGWSTRVLPSVEVPAFEGSLELRYAEALEDA